MKGKQKKSEPLFAYVRVEDIVPKDHLLRKVDKVIDFSVISEETDGLYSHTGRPSVDPEVLVRMMLIGYFFGITSERRLCEEVQLNLAYRWFCGLTLEDKVPDHSTFSKNRHGRFSKSNLFRKIFESVVKQAIERGIVSGKDLIVDATPVRADASKSSIEPIMVSMTPDDFLNQVENENPISSTKEKDEPKKRNPYHKDTHKSSTDPDAQVLKKPGFPSQLSYSHNILVDDLNRVILDVEVTEPNYGIEGQIAGEMVERSRFSFGVSPETIAGDSAYGTGRALRRLFEAGITPLVSDPGREGWGTKEIFGKERFDYDKDRDIVICPAGKVLKRSRDLPKKYITIYTARSPDCRDCILKTQCTRGKQRVFSRHWDQEYLDRARTLRKTKLYKKAQKYRKKIESLFGEAKEKMGLKRARLRGFQHVREQSILTATAQNIKRIIGALGKPLHQAISLFRPLGSILRTCITNFEILKLRSIKPI